MVKAKDKSRFLPPDQRPITEIAAKRLAAMSGLQIKEIAGHTVAELTEKYRWQIDLELLFFRRICGQVVKRDPISGKTYPVPFATVHVEDTDCNLLGYFPGGWPWGWFFPLWCHREVIATVLTDECGRFCVNIPRWEIDWILKWRHERICFPIIFERPWIRDLLDDLFLEYDPPRIKWPRPEPDPVPWLERIKELPLRRVEELVGPELAGDLMAHGAARAFGEKHAVTSNFLNAPVFAQAAPPPLPNEFKSLGMKEAQPFIAQRFNLDTSAVRNFNPEIYIGPFKRCFDVWVPEWTPLLDVPDITFRVTQDVDGDGDEETIYGESFFDVRWDSGPIADITLEADPIALAGVTCDPPDVPCAEPAIVLAGKMPMHNLPAPADPYLDQTSGYARRTNRPHPSGSPVDPPPNPLAASPLAGTFPLYGCNQHDGAVYYRLQYAYKAPGAGSFTSPVPFAGHSWPLYRWVGSPGHLEKLQVNPDTNGWYEILNLADGWLPTHLLLNWPSASYPDGLYKVHMQLGNASKAVIHSTPEISLRIDNAHPAGSNFTGLAWRVEGSSSWTNLSLVCPVVARPAGVNIEFKVSYLATAAHLRSFSLSGGGCGGGGMSLVSAPLTGAYWHTDPLDNSRMDEAIFRLPHTNPQGAYSFQMVIYSRAFNPDDANGLTADWDYNPVHRWIWRTLSVAVVNT